LGDTYVHVFCTRELNANYGISIVGVQKMRPSMTLRHPTLDDFAFLLATSSGMESYLCTEYESDI
jgi:hypothetical protein